MAIKNPNIFKRFFSNFSGTQAINAPVKDFYTSINNLGLDYINPNIDLTYPEKLAVVYTCIKVLAESVSKLPITVKDKKNNIINNHFLSNIFIRPNTYQNQQVWTSQIIGSVFSMGNSLVYINRKSGTPQSLEPVSRGYISDAQIINGKLWYYSKSDGKAWRSEDMLHFKLLSIDGLFGLNPIESLRLSMNLNQKSSATVERFYTNNGQSTKYLQFNGTNLSIIQEAVKVFESTYSGVENAFKLPLLPPNTEIKELQSQINDDKFLQTASFSEKTIASAFGVPIHFLGHSEQKFSNFEQQALSFKQNTISSLVAIIKSELEFKLLTLDEIKAGIHIDIDVEKLIDTSLIEKANYIKTAISSGTMTPNEGCQRMGTKPYDTEFGDYHFIQMQNIPIEKYDIYHNNTALNAQNSDNSGDKASEDIIINNNPDAKGDN